MNFDDPIVFPGESRATHLHSFFGNTVVNASSNNTSINTTGQQHLYGWHVNRSAYWAPAVIDTATSTPGRSGSGTEIDRENVVAGVLQDRVPGCRVEHGAELPARVADHRW